MKNKVIILFFCILLLNGCVKTSLTIKEPEKMSRIEAESKALDYFYKHTSNKQVFDKELTIENYVHDSWKEEDTWYVILYIGHTFIEVRVYDDGSNKIKILLKTDYI